MHHPGSCALSAAADVLSAAVLIAFYWAAFWIINGAGLD